MDFVFANTQILRSAMMRLVILVLLSFLHIIAFSQGKPCSAGKKHYDRVGKYLQMRDWNNALIELKRLQAKCPKFAEAFAIAGDIYTELGQYDSALANYERAIRANPDMEPTIYYLAGKTAFQVKQYDKAIQYLERFLQEPNLPPVIKEKAKKFLRNSRVAKELVQNPVPFDPKNLGPNVNSKYSEYLPALTADEKTLIFTRRLSRDGYMVNEDFYISTRREDGTWTEARPIGPPINTPLNEGAQTISPDGRTIYFTGCNRRDGHGSCDIYVTQRIGGRWTKPVNLGPPINTQYWESQPSISPDGRVLFFVSNRPGGLGGRDIWYSIKQEDGSWSEPVNLGPPINTPEDDFSPFLHTDGRTLYFASEGHPGMGRADIFVARRQKDGTWSQPKNLGYPINTENEESSLIVSASGRWAYFASDRLGGYGKMDLYVFELYEEARPTPVTYVKGKVLDAETGRPISATLELTNLKSGEVVSQTKSDPVTGEFLLSLPSGQEYGLHASAKGFLFYSEHFALHDSLAFKPYHLTIKLSPIKQGATMTLRNIFFKFDSYELTEESRHELDKLVEFLKENPNVKIEIAGHTDDVGSFEYNMTLSEKRAKSVYDYLVSKGISPDRMTYKGYGFTKPLVKDTTEEARALNRRTEIIIIEN